MPDGRQDSTDYDPLEDGFLSDDEGKKTIELCVIKMNDGGKEVIEVATK